MNLNKTMLIGNLTRDPEVKTTPSGSSVARFDVVTNQNWKNDKGEKQSKANFHKVVAWRKLGDICGQFLKKGSKVYVEGRLENRSWDTKEGQKRYITEVIADNLIMLDKKGGKADKAMDALDEILDTSNDQVVEAEVGF